jgi:CDP-diacylglycerol--glycerol-3-phosphate 3-phosphatidyltransferase
VVLDYLKRSFDRLPIPREGREIVNLPNSITMLRILIIPVLFLLLLRPGRMLSLSIAVLFLLAALTDLLDGYVARRYEIVTKTGMLLDPIADKIIVNTAMILLIPIGRIPAWIVAVIVMRDFIVDGVRHVASAGGFILSASTLAKYKAVTQIAAITALLIHYPLFGLDAHDVGIVILYAALILSIGSGMDYLVKFYRQTFRVRVE